MVARATAATPPAVSTGEGRCPGMKGDPLLPLGDEYVGTLPLTDAGVYDFALRANGVPFPGYPKSTMVLPSAVTAFELAAPALLPVRPHRYFPPRRCPRLLLLIGRFRYIISRAEG